ncbi:MAG TPA: NAD(P)/FAD-dependent oxidoreductase [Bryobacteraceae bacterium]|nr:NAD(P)/FAD-dependent oxidoreductase [Bryobacteraceae bacterium]
MQHVVILGGGFGGLYAAKALSGHAKVTLIDRRNFHLFQPLLYQVATGSLSPGEIATPLRSLVRGHRDTFVLLDEAVGLDAENRRVVLAREAPVAYTHLIVATGANNHYFGHEEWQTIAPGLKSIEDATAMRHKILAAFEAAEREPDPAVRRAWLTFVVVGAGPTGVELAGALAEIARDTLRRDFRNFRTEDAQILLLDGSPHVLPAYPEDLSEQAARQLIKLGVRPRTRVQVTAMDAEGLTLKTPEGEERLASRTVLWAAGVKPSPFGRVLAEHAGAKLDRQGRVMVAPDLSIPGHPEIFVIGDLAVLEQDGKALPGVAPVAMQEGRYVAGLIRVQAEGRAVAPFRYHDKGSLAVIGRAAGVADFGRLHFHGWPAWLLWLFVHLMYLAQFRNRVLVFIRWGFQYLTFDRGARLITGN